MTSSIANKGFTLIEFLMVMVLIGVIAMVSIEIFGHDIDEARFEETVVRLSELKKGIIGDAEIKESHSRSSFGYLGDVGKLPGALTDLITNPGWPVYAINTTGRIGIGWNGPYLTGASAAADYAKDAWGRTLAYSNGTPATITSYGRDGGVGGSGLDQDIVVSIDASFLTSVVQGFICNKGAAFANKAEVELNYPRNGALQQMLVTLVAADKGNFTFPAGIPPGIRSLTVYMPTKAAATTTIGPINITVDRPNFVVPCERLDVSLY